MQGDYDDQNIMHFGKHKGRRLGDISMSYFNYIWELWDKDSSLKQKLSANSEDGQLARYIQVAKRAEKTPA